MKKLLFIALVAFCSCNNGDDTPGSTKGCVTINASDLSTEQKELLLDHGWDSTKCYTIEP